MRVPTWCTTLIGLSTFACAGPSRRPAGPPADPATQLRALCADYWDALMERSPTWATYIGDFRFNDRLEDLSPEGRERWRQTIERFRSRLRRIPREALAGEDRITHELLEYELNDALEGMLHKSWEYEVDQMYGPQVRFLELVNTAPVGTAKHLEDLARRYEAFGRYMDQYIANLREGMARGRTQFRGAVERVIAQTRAIVETPVEQCPLLAHERLAQIAPEHRARLERAVREVVYPAYRRLLAFLEGEYLAAARTAPGLSAVRGGRDAYAYFVRHHTTTGLSPQEIHRIGLRELERLRGEMEEIARRRGHAGDLASFLESVRSDPSAFAQSREELLDGFRAILARMNERLPRLFLRVPSTPCEIRAIEEYREADAPAAYYYGPPDPEGEAEPRPGIFYVNTYRPETRPKYGMVALAAHEAVPGHHFQIAFAVALRDLPKFRRHAGPTAFVEGWALYAELLADEIGMYEDDLSRFGMLTEQAWRAARLVVDTGIHEMGWSREQAVEFMLRNVALSRHEAETEVDRYIVWPGQALAYMIGRMKFQQLRSRAGERLGERFDVRAFHDEVLRHGALPLSVLEHVAERWIAESAAGSP